MNDEIGKHYWLLKRIEEKVEDNLIVSHFCLLNRKSILNRK